MLIWDAHFYFIFVQFMQFPVLLHFGLAHSGSQPLLSELHQQFKDDDKQEKKRIK